MLLLLLAPLMGLIYFQSFFLRVTQKPKSHLEVLNEPVLVPVTSGDEADHWAGRVKGQAVLWPALLLAVESHYRRARDA